MIKVEEKRAARKAKVRLTASLRAKQALLAMVKDATVPEKKKKQVVSPAVIKAETLVEASAKSHGKVPMSCDDVTLCVMM